MFFFFQPWRTRISNVNLHFAANRKSGFVSPSVSPISENIIIIIIIIIRECFFVPIDVPFSNLAGFGGPRNREMTEPPPLKVIRSTVHGRPLCGGLQLQMASLQMDFGRCKSCSGTILTIGLGNKKQATCRTKRRKGLASGRHDTSAEPCPYTICNSYIKVPPKTIDNPLRPAISCVP